MNTDKIIAESIAKEYAPKDHSELYALQKLDRKVKVPAEIFTFSFGVISALIFGLGLCLSMQVLGTGIFLKVLGIIIGIAGFIMMGINYPLYKRILEERKKKYSYEIIELAKKVCEK